MLPLNTGDLLLAKGGSLTDLNASARFDVGVVERDLIVSLAYN